jgi:hypothetical protein
MDVNDTQSPCTTHLIPRGGLSEDRSLAEPGDIAKRREQSTKLAIDANEADHPKPAPVIYRPMCHLPILSVA